MVTSQPGLSYAERAKKNIKSPNNRGPAAPSAAPNGTGVPPTTPVSSSTANDGNTSVAPTPSSTSSTSASPAPGPTTTSPNVWQQRQDKMTAKQQTQTPAQPRPSPSRSAVVDRPEDDDPFVVKPRLQPTQRPIPPPDDWPAVGKTTADGPIKQEQESVNQDDAKQTEPTAEPSHRNQPPSRVSPQPLPQSQQLSPSHSRSHSQYSNNRAPRHDRSRTGSIQSSPRLQMRDHDDLSAPSMSPQQPMPYPPYNTYAYPMQGPYQPIPSYYPMYEYNQAASPPNPFWNSYHPSPNPMIAPSHQHQPPYPVSSESVEPTSQQFQRRPENGAANTPADSSSPRPSSQPSQTQPQAPPPQPQPPIKLPPKESQPVSMPASRIVSNMQETKVVFGSVNGVSPPPSPAPAPVSISEADDKKDVIDLTGPKTAVQWEFGRFDDGDSDREDASVEEDMTAEEEKHVASAKEEVSAEPAAGPSPISIPSSVPSSDLSASSVPSPQVQLPPPPPSHFIPPLPLPPGPALAPMSALGMMSPLDLSGHDPAYMRSPEQLYHAPQPPSFEVQDFGYGFGQRRDGSMVYSPTQRDRDAAEGGAYPPPPPPPATSDFRQRRGSYNGRRPGRGFRWHGGYRGGGAAAALRSPQQPIQQNPYVNGAHMDMNGYYHQPSPPFVPPAQHQHQQRAQQPQPQLQQYPVPAAAAASYAQPMPMPFSQLSFPLDSTAYYLLGQLEYYLSPQNMAQDFWLRRRMDSLGFIPIQLLASFNRVKQLTNGTGDVNVVKDILELSSLAEVQGEFVRMGNGEWQKFVLPGAEHSVFVPPQEAPLPHQQQGNGHEKDVRQANGGEHEHEHEHDQEDEDEDDVVFVMGNGM